MNLHHWNCIVAGLVLGLFAATCARAQSAPPSAAHRYDVRAYGAADDAHTLDTAAIQKAIRTANLAGGGTVVFPPGIYITGTLELLSNVTLDVEAGATLRGSPNLADYRPIKDFGFGRNYGVDLTGEGFLLGMIVAHNADNIAITGQGTIDGNDSAFFDFTKPHYTMDFDPKSTRQGQKFLDAVLATGDGPVAEKPTGRPGTMIVFFHCNNIRIDTVALRNAPNWTLHFNVAHNAVVHGIHILNDPRIPNNDGLDCMDCHNVQVSDSDIRTGDDDFAIVGSEDITISNCTLFSNSSAIRLEDSRYSIFSNLVIHTNRGIGIYERGAGTTSNILFTNILMETHLLTGHWWGKGEPIYVAAGTAGGVGGHIREIRFVNIHGEAENGLILYGDPGTSLENITLDHVSFRFRVTRPEVNAAVGGNFDLRWTAKSVSDGVLQHEIPALYGRYIHGLKLEDVDFRWAAKMPTWYSSDFELKDVTSLTVDRFTSSNSEER